ncbi:DUF3515 family protein [Georgenia faecalis]|uniref:DUF3515 family protein n=1 Tax=Georgenia faecalis TaxID=2483799 RepID=A0ABV9DA22_9MICO|nr:DUF3515 family protein [Georgenia faecalis]
MRRGGLACAGAAVALLAACAPAVSVPAAPDAADPVCGQVLQDLPEVLGGGERRSITSQATAAWGDPPITLRCGVEPPGPTVDRCLTVEADGSAVDWIALEGDDPTLPEHAQQGQGSWAFVTYGRVPAIEVVVPVERAGDQPTAVLVELARAVEHAPAQDHCVGVTDVY